MTTNIPANFPENWAFSAAHGESVRILDVETVWNHTVCQVWIPQLGTVERVPAESLAPPQPTKATGLDRITYAVADARMADALTQDVLLAPLEAGVIPLPHQFHALTRAVTGDRVRYQAADEVGLGKNIEASLIFREPKSGRRSTQGVDRAGRSIATCWWQRTLYDSLDDRSIAIGYSQFRTTRQLLRGVRAVNDLCTTAHPTVSYLKVRQRPLPVMPVGSSAERWYLCCC